MASRRSEWRQTALIVVILFGVVGTGAAWAAGRLWVVGPFKCIGWELDRDRLRLGSHEDRLDEAERIDKCGNLEGRTRAQVLARLGKPDVPKSEPRADRQWNYFVAEVNNYMGPGDAGYLFIRFNAAGRVDHVDAPP